MQRKSFVLAGIGTLFLMSGCSQNGAGVSLLDESATADQTSRSDPRFADVEPDSARFVAEHEGISYFLGKPADPGRANGVCLMAMEMESTVCGGPSHDDTELVTLEIAGTEARVVRDGADTTDLASDGWTQIHENLLIR